MDRLDLELYADRLARHASRLADELAAARLRLTWAELERGARVELGAGRSLLLESLGVLAQVAAVRRRRVAPGAPARAARGARRAPGLRRALHRAAVTLFDSDVEKHALGEVRVGRARRTASSRASGPAATSASSTASAPEASGTLCTGAWASTSVEVVVVHAAVVDVDAQPPGRDLEVAAADPATRTRPPRATAAARSRAGEEVQAVGRSPADLPLPVPPRGRAAGARAGPAGRLRRIYAAFISVVPPSKRGTPANGPPGRIGSGRRPATPRSATGRRCGSRS